MPKKNFDYPVSIQLSKAQNNFVRREAWKKKESMSVFLRRIIEAAMKKVAP